MDGLAPVTEDEVRLSWFQLKFPSEGVLNCELHDPRRHVIENLAEGGSVLLTRGDGARVIRTIGQKVGTVCNIECFSAKIHALAFTNTNRFRQCEVHIEIAGTYERIRGHVAPDSIRHRSGKRGSVEPAVYGLALAIGIWKDLRRAIAHRRQRDDAGPRSGGERLA